jgi:hypothetical protein
MRLKQLAIAASIIATYVSACPQIPGPGEIIMRSGISVEAGYMFSKCNLKTTAHQILTGISIRGFPSQRCLDGQIYVGS